MICLHEALFLSVTFTHPSIPLRLSFLSLPFSHPPILSPTQAPSATACTACRLKRRGSSASWPANPPQPACCLQQQQQQQQQQPQQQWPLVTRRSSPSHSPSTSLCSQRWVLCSCRPDPHSSSLTHSPSFIHICSPLLCVAPADLPLAPLRSHSLSHTLTCAFLSSVLLLLQMSELSRSWDQRRDAELDRVLQLLQRRRTADRTAQDLIRCGLSLLTRRPSRQPLSPTLHVTLSLHSLSHSSHPSPDHGHSSPLLYPPPTLSIPPSLPQPLLFLLQLCPAAGALGGRGAAVAV
jgi:hypothetical protein